MKLLDTLATGLRRRLPMILQTEAAECGLACLAMVLGRHGTITDLATLRGRHAVSMKGMTLSTLARIAESEHLGTRAVRLELDELGKLRLPAILHWDLNHFVVLREVSGGKATLHDPSVGERRMALDELSRHFTGVALEVWPDAGFAPKVERTRLSLARLVGEIAGFWPTLGQIFLLSLALEVLVLVGPLLMQWILDHVIVSRDANLLTTLAAGFLLLLVLQQGFSLARSWVLLVVNASVRVQWRSNVVAHMMRLPLAYFQKRHLGDIVSRIGAIDEIQRVLTNTFVEAIFDGLLVLLTLAMMFIYSPAMAGVALVAVVLYLVIRLVWLRPLYLATEEQIVRGATQATHLLESIRGIRAIKLFARQQERKAAWQTLLVGETNATLSIQKMQIFYRLVNATLSGTINIALLWLGAQQVLAGSMTVGMMMAFLAYRGQFDGRVSSLIDHLINFKMLQLYGERLGDLVLTEAEPSGRVILPRAGEAPTIHLDDVGFRYAPHEPDVLAHITLTINPGECVAITGDSGGGKTTLVNVLLGVLEPVQGRIRIDEQPLAQFGVENWRRGVGTVMQDDTLFAGSIADNISFFDPKADLAHVEHCAALAALNEDIGKMPMAFQTLVGDMGTSLSGGQKQRILLARALYKRPKVLILDEATSHLDARREAEVNAAIHDLAVTRIVVAHRAETIAATSRVIELKNGQVTFDGPTETYMRQGQWARA